MRASSDSRRRPVTALAIQALEPRTPLAANVTTVVSPAVAKVTHTPAIDVTKPLVHAVAAPRVAVQQGNLAAAGQAATAAKEAARAAAAAAQAGHALPDVSRSVADSVAGRVGGFSVPGGGAGSQRAATGVPGLDCSVAGPGDGLAALREKYGLLGVQAGGGGTGASGGDDVRAAAMAKKGMAAADDSVADDLDARSDAKEREANALYDKGLVEEGIAREQQKFADANRDSSNKESKKEAADAQELADASQTRAEMYYQQAVDRMREAVDLAQRAADHRNKTKPKASERPAPDDCNAPPHRATPPGTQAGASTSRPVLASQPVPDADVTARRANGSVRGQPTTNPALDHGRDYVAPRSAVSAVDARNAAFAQIGKAINPVNKR